MSLAGVEWKIGLLTADVSAHKVMEWRGPKEPFFD